MRCGARLLPRPGGPSVALAKAKYVCWLLWQLKFAGRTAVEQNWASMLATAIQEARTGLAEGGLPIGAAMFNRKGELLSSGHNRRVQQSDPSAHAETDAFRRAGRLRSYREVVMVTTLAPCWYCSGLVRQFGIRTLVVGESRTFSGGLDWLRSAGVTVFDLDSDECVTMMQSYIRDHAAIWYEDIGEDTAPAV